MVMVIFLYRISFFHPKLLILPWKQSSVLTNSASISEHDVAVERLYARLRYVSTVEPTTIYRDVAPDKLIPAGETT